MCLHRNRHGSRRISGWYASGWRRSGVFLSGAVLLARHGKLSVRGRTRLLLSHLATMHGERAWIRSLLPPESMVARSARTAEGARQEPSAQSSVMSLALRRIVWSDGTSRPDDYNIVHHGQVVGPHVPHEQHGPRVVALDAERNLSTDTRREWRGCRYPGRCQGGISSRVGPAVW